MTSAVLQWGSRRAVSVGGGKSSNSESPVLTVSWHSNKLKLIRLDFCKAVLLLLFCSWSEVTKQLLSCPQCQVLPGGEHSSHQLRPTALQGCTSLTCSKGGREKQQQQHQVQTHRGDWAEPLYSAPAALWASTGLRMCPWFARSHPTPRAPGVPHSLWEQQLFLFHTCTYQT